MALHVNIAWNLKLLFMFLFLLNMSFNWPSVFIGPQFSFKFIYVIFYQALEHNPNDSDDDDSSSDDVSLSLLGLLQY